MAITFNEIRAEVARRATDFISGTATGGGTTSVVDNINLTQDDDFWAEQWVLFTSGVNNGLIRRASASSQSSNSLTLYSAVNSVANGDFYELYRRFSPVDIFNAVNSAVNKSWPDFFETVKFGVATAVSGQYRYSIYSNLSGQAFFKDTSGLPLGNNGAGGGAPMVDDGFIGIEYQILDNPAVTDYPYERLSQDKYDIIRQYNLVARHEEFIVQLRFNPQTNRKLRLLFASPLANVVTGTDRIHLDTPHLEWLYTQAIADLWRTEVSRSADIARRDAEGQLKFWDAEEDKLRKRLRFKKENQQLERTVFEVYSSWRED